MNVPKLSHRKRFITTVIAIFLVITLPLSALLIREIAAPTTHEVKITGFAFVPQNITINLGDTVTWNNTDPVIHTLWFVFVTNGSTYLLSDPIPPDTTWMHTFNDAVELQYYSFERLWITGFINVTAEVHDVAVTNVTLYKNVVGQGYDNKINATVENQGSFTETFNVTAYANTTTIEIAEVTLASGTSTIITFTWDTTGVVKGNYTIKATADYVTGEVDLLDNTFIDSWVVVTFPSDFDGDGDVDFDDFVMFLSAWIDYWFDPPLNPEYKVCDFDNDNDIDFDDFTAFLLGWIDYWFP